jgi:hypothetical protein
MRFVHGDILPRPAVLGEITTVSYRLEHPGRLIDETKHTEMMHARAGGSTGRRRRQAAALTAIAQSRETGYATPKYAVSMRNTVVQVQVPNI